MQFFLCYDAMKKKFKKWSKWLLIITALLIVGIWGTNRWVTAKTEHRVFSNIDALPYNKVGLLLGTSKYAAGGGINLFYKYRIEAAVALFKAGKIDVILVSGDNGAKGYNEPEMMQQDLVAAGIPLNRIVLDYAGFRTLDSILRAKEVFGTAKFTVISQRFHNERAVCIAQYHDMETVAFNAKDVVNRSGTKVLLREKLARVKMVLDLMFGQQPKFYGPKILIP